LSSTVMVRPTGCAQDPSFWFKIPLILPDCELMVRPLPEQGFCML